MYYTIASCRSHNHHLSNVPRHLAQAAGPLTTRYDWASHHFDL